MAQAEHQDALKILSHNGVTWVDVRQPSAEVFARLEQEYHLHPVHLKETVQKVHFDQVEREAHYIFLLLHVLSYDSRNEKIVTSQVGIFLGKDYLITVHDGTNNMVRDLFEACSQDDGQRNRYCQKSPGHLLYGIVRKLIDDLTYVNQIIAQDIDELEDRVFDDEGSDAYAIGKLRQKVIRLKRIVEPLAMVLQDLAAQIDAFSGENLARQYANNTKTVNKLREMIEEAQETIEIYKDADFTVSTEKTNGILALLTLVFTFTIPATVIGTFYGMNILLPGGIQTGAWHFFGQYTTLKLVTLVSVLFAAAMYWYFKRRKWI